MLSAPVAAADWLVIAPVVIPIALRRAAADAPPSPALAGGVRVWRSSADAGGRCRCFSRASFPTARLSMTMGRWLPPFGISFAADIAGRRLCAGRGARRPDLRGLLRTGHRCDRPALRLLSVPDAADGRRQRRLPDRRHLQPLRLVRGLLIASFGLLVLGSERAQIDGAMKYAILNLLATTLFLIATGYLYGDFGTLNMADIAAQGSGPARLRAADDDRRALLAGLRHEGGGLSGQFLAAGLLPHAAHRDVGAVRRAADQGRHLCAAARAGHDPSRRAAALSGADRMGGGRDDDARRASARWRRPTSGACSVSW